MTKRLAAAAVAIGLVLIPAVAMARGEERAPQKAPPSSSIETPPTTESPPTTSEFGTETEIEIALDDEGNIVPAHD